MGKMIDTTIRNKKKKVVQLLLKGYSYNQIAKIVHCSKSTIFFHARRLDIPKQEKPKYDWQAIQAYHDAGHKRAECLEKFGFVGQTWNNAIKAGRLKPRAWKIPLEELLVYGRKTARTHLKKRLLRGGMLEYRCYECGISSWRKLPLALELEHKSGDKRDNRLNNLCLLCPNCHSQTPTHGSKNRGRYLPCGVTGNTPGSEPGDSRFEA